MLNRFRQMLAAAKDIIDVQGYTSAQLASITKAQLAAHLELPVGAAFWSGGNIGLFSAIRGHLITHQEAKENKAIANNIKNKLTNDEKQWLRDNAAKYSII